MVHIDYPSLSYVYNTEKKMEQKMNTLMDVIENVKKHSDGKNRLYLGSCLKQLKMYALTDRDTFTSLVRQMSMSYSCNVDTQVQRSITQFLSPETSPIEKNVVCMLYEKYDHIVDVVGSYVYKHKIDENVGYLVLESLDKAARRKDKKDISLIVSALLFSMQKMSISGGNAQDIINHLLSLTSDPHNSIDLNTLERN